MTVRILHGDCRDVLATLPAESAGIVPRIVGPGWDAAIDAAIAAGSGE